MELVGRVTYTALSDEASVTFVLVIPRHYYNGNDADRIFSGSIDSSYWRMYEKMITGFQNGQTDASRTYFEMFENGVLNTMFDQRQKK
jgi:hypothetical protein